MNEKYSSHSEYNRFFIKYQNFKNMEDEVIAGNWTPICCVFAVNKSMIAITDGEKRL